MRSSIVYVTPLVIDEMKERYGIEWYSVAGQNKMRGMIRSIQTTDKAVTVVTPIAPTGRHLSYRPQYHRADPETGANVVVPPTINFFGINYLNRILVTFLTSIVLLQTHRNNNTIGTLFYNFRLITSVPAFIAQALLDKPAVIEYADGLWKHDSTPMRISATVLRRTIGTRLRGAICVNHHLLTDLGIENAAIVRGFPSIGLPEQLPDAEDETEDIVVMFAGHFDEVRGIDMYLSLIPDIEFCDVQFWVSGTGKQHEINRVQEAITSLNDDRVQFFGTLPCDEYKERLVRADIFVNLQDPEAEISEYTFPSKLLDFMAAGGVIVSTDMSDLAANFDDEMLIAGTTNTEVVATLETAIEQCRNGEASVDGGTAWVKKNCTEEQIGREICEVFNGTAIDK